MRWRARFIIFLIVTVFYWKLTLTRQFTFLESMDQAHQVLPWLDLDVSAIRHGEIPLWTPYEWDGQPLLGQVQPGVVSPFTFLLSLAPLKDGHVQIHWVHLWFVFIHLVGAWFAYALLRDLQLSESSAITGAVLYATMGFYGSTDWPQFMTSAIWAPLIFLFIFRAARGHKPLASSCLAGLFAGLAWLSGYYAPPLYFTLAGLCTFLWILRSKRAAWVDSVRQVGAYLLVLGLVSALQLLPAIEYGRTALRWTASGAMHWNDRVPFTEHADNGFRPADLLHLVIQGADKQVEPFTGTVALCLAVIAVLGAFRRSEVRILSALALASLLLSMPRNVFLYGPLYVLVPMLEKARSPSMLMSVFHFAIAALAAFGTEQLLDSTPRLAIERIAKIAAGFGATLLVLYLVADFLRPTVTSVFLAGDARPAMFAFMALLFAAVCMASLRGAIRPTSAAALICLFALIEQGNVAGYSWVHNSEKERKTFLKPIDESRSMAAFLRAHQPSRTEINRADFGTFNFGDWHRIETVEALVPSMLAITNKLGWWDDRCARLFGVRYTISRKPTRAGQVDVFTNAVGMKIFENPAVLPRAWAVHSVRQSPDETRAVAMILDGSIDPGREAIVSGAPPQLETCSPPDIVQNARFGLQSVSVEVQMACRGLLLVSDNWYPGWRATVDGKSQPIFKADTTIRAVVVEKGKHTVKMNYRPTSVIAGFLLFLTGAAMTALVVRTENRRMAATGLKQ